jgi:hypothetical protein
MVGGIIKSRYFMGFDLLIPNLVNNIDFQWSFNDMVLPTTATKKTAK